MKKNIKKWIALMITAIMIFSVACVNSGESDKEAAKAVIGEYQVVANESDNDDEYVGTWWHLSILEEDDMLMMSIYDNEAGNPGIEGEVTSIDDKHISLKYDPDYFDELPCGIWSVDGDYLETDYELTADGIKLTNNDFTLTFVKES